MQVSKWGNSLAVRLPKVFTDRLALKEGDEIEIWASDDRSIRIGRKRTREEAIESLRRFEGWMPADFKFDREEANAR